MTENAAVPPVDVASVMRVGDGATARADAGQLRRVVTASSLGAIFEAYDLVLYGPMAAIVAAEFFPGSIRPMPTSLRFYPPR